jgi:hypothetical protein
VDRDLQSGRGRFETLSPSSEGRGWKREIYEARNETAQIGLPSVVDVDAV